MIGQVGTFSGLAGTVFGPAQAGLRVWATWINARGGLAGHPVKVYSYDDQASTSRAASITSQLLTERKAQAIASAQVPLTVEGLKPSVRKHKVPVVGGDVGSLTWYSDPSFFPQASNPFDGGGENLVRYVVREKRLTRFGIIYCYEADGCSGVYRQMVPGGGARRAGATVVYEAQASLGTSDFTAYCVQARNAGAQMIYVAMDGASLGRVANACAQQGYRPTILNGATSVTPEQARNPNLQGMTVFANNFVWTQGASPAEREYQDALRTYAPSLVSSPATAGAWAAGKLLEAAVGKVGTAAWRGPLTSALISQGLWALKNESLGGLVPGALTFRRGSPAAPNDCVYIAVVQESTWIAPIGDRQICRTS